MGNCHAVDAVSATVEHPDGKVEKLYFSSSARQLMLQHPGHYVALLPPPPPLPPSASPHGSSVVLVQHHVKRKLKLLPPDSMLNVGSCYKLVSFEDVLSELSDNGSMAHQTSRRSKHPQQVKVSEDKVAEGRQQQSVGGGVSKAAAAVKHINQLRAMLSKSMFVSQQQQQHKENNNPQDVVVPDVTRGIARSFSSPLESVRPVARGGVWRPNLQSIAERGR